MELTVDVCDWCYTGYSEYSTPTHFDLPCEGKEIDLCEDCYKEYQKELEEKRDAT